MLHADSQMFMDIKKGFGAFPFLRKLGESQIFSTDTKAGKQYTRIKFRLSPQVKLDEPLVPWETRYKVAWDRDYSDHYGDAGTASGAANKVYILYDPYEPLGTQNVARFQGDNVVKLRAPLLGHRLGSSLKQMGILSRNKNRKIRLAMKTLE